MKGREILQTRCRDANQSQSAINVSCYCHPELQDLTYNWGFTRTKTGRESNDESTRGERK